MFVDIRIENEKRKQLNTTFGRATHLEIILQFFLKAFGTSRRVVDLQSSEEHNGNGLHNKSDMKEIQKSHVSKNNF